MENLSVDEWFPVVDENGNVISKALRSTCHDGRSMLLHPVVHLHLFNKNGELFLQKRASTKDLLPGYWDTSVGGHVSPGESSEQALKREVLEEIGLTDFTFDFITRYVWESPREKELVYVYKGSSEKEPVINKDEIDDGRFWKIGEIRDKTGHNIFTPNFEHEFLSIIGKESLH